MNQTTTAEVVDEANAARKETRSERRKRETHELLIEAAGDLLLEGGPAAVTSRAVADRADVAVGTFYNHFDSVEDVIDATLTPLRIWALEHAERILAADDYQEAIAMWVADFLVQLERDGRPYQLARAANLPVLGSSTDDLVERMRERWGGLWEERGIAPGTAGPLMLKLMAMCGDLYGSAPMTDGTAEHLARMVHAANTSFSDRVEQQVAITLQHRERLRSGSVS